MSAPIDTNDQEIPTIEDETPNEGQGIKKAISLRVALEDLELARELGGELEIGYQVLLNQLIHDGLQAKKQDVEYGRLVARIRASLGELKAAQDLAGSPAVKAAQELLASPAIKAAQNLLESPAVKAAQDAANAPLQKVKDFGASSASKAAEEFANSPLAKAIKDLTSSPAFQTAQELATSTGAKLQREWEKSPGGRLADAILHGKDGAPSPELVDLNKAVQDIQDALKKAGLM